MNEPCTTGDECYACGDADPTLATMVERGEAGVMKPVCRDCVFGESDVGLLSGYTEALGELGHLILFTGIFALSLSASANLPPLQRGLVGAFMAYIWYWGVSTQPLEELINDYDT